jgi:Fur family transcriptional regulator, ferric uptake regulator
MKMSENETDKEISSSFSFAEEKELFLNYVQKFGLRRTAQRDLILEVFLRTQEHLSSEDLYDLVKKQDPTVGQTTVYRTLKLLSEAGLAREVRLGDGRTHYEHHYNREHHDHMICTECGRVVEFFSEELEAMQNEIAAKYNFVLTQHSLRLLGLCEDCQKVAKAGAASGIQPRVRVQKIES